ncbi:MAG: ABC transporter permease [Elusimicrobia bacterium]|nr:ABC transporter permease [Elusimicrobiota bacterium]
MNAGEAVRSAAREIRVHKVRSLLSFSAISVGAASLLYTLAQTRGMQEASRKNLEMMGPGALQVERAPHYEGKGLSKGLTIGDAEAIRAQFPELYMVSPRAQTWARELVAGERRVQGVQVVGVTADWRKRDWVYRLRGRFIGEDDVRDAARVCVVVEPGGWVKKPFWMKFWNWKSDFDELVSHADLLGRRVSMGGHDYTVVGAMRLPPRDKDPRWNAWNNPEVLVPLTVFGSDLAPDDEEGLHRIDTIKIDTGDEKTIPSVKRRLEALLEQRHRGEKDFEVKNLREEVEDSMKEEGKYIAVAIALGIVALLSGGIGILNVTLAAVYSRVREIGVRRALGAERMDVMALFLAEAALLGLAGGVAGVGLGVGLIEKLARGADRDVADLEWWHALAMVALSSVVASAFAAYPAWRASLLDPVEALREEP